MPTFRFSFPDLVSSGPVLQVRIGPSREFREAARQFGRIASPTVVTALIDTGAQTTVLSPEIATKLGIKPVGFISVMTPTSTEPVRCDQFHVDVFFTPEVVVEKHSRRPGAAHRTRFSMFDRS